MFDFLSKLFDVSDFPPRWHCGDWSAGHGWLHILSDLGIWSAYVAIPCVLGYFVLRRRDIPFRAVFLLFGAFILACGTTHLMEAALFWWPAYRLAGVLKLFTALVSWGTVLALVPVTPKILAMRNPEELEREIQVRKRAEDDLRLNAEIVKRVPVGLLVLRLDNLDDDRSLRIVDVNPGASALLGFDVVRMLGRTLIETFPANTPAMLKAYADVVRTGIATELEDLEYGDERVKASHWSVKAFPLPDRSVGLAFENISARKRAEAEIRRLNAELEQRVADRTQALQSSEMRYRRITTNMLDMVGQLDGKGA